MVGQTPMSSMSSSSSSAPSAVAEQSENSSQYVGFQIAGQEYAFRIEQIQEIVILEQVTTVPQVPECCEGVSNLRGSIIPIINLRKLFGLAPKVADADTRTIVVNFGGRTMGCTVDMVSQVIRIPDDNLQPAPETLIVDGADYIIGFAKLDERLMIVLDIDKLLDPEQLNRIRNISIDDETLPT